MFTNSDPRRGVNEEGALQPAKLSGLPAAAMPVTLFVMIQTVEAVVSPEGAVRLLKPVRVAGLRRALVMILDEEPLSVALECARLSEASLAEDWNRPEEDQAWAHLQQGR